MKDLNLKDKLKNLNRRLVLIYSGSLLLLVVFSMFANQVLKSQAALQATSFIRRQVKLGDTKEMILTLSQANLDYFTALAYFDSDDKRVFLLPTESDPHEMDQTSTLNALKFGYITTPLYYDESEAHTLGRLVFAYNRYSYLPQAFALWALLVLITLPLMAGARRSVSLKYETDLKIKSELLRAELAKDVRHDIRSPLVSLQGFLKTTDNLTDEQRKILGRTVRRIMGIIADLEDEPGRTAAHQSMERYAAIEEVIRDVVKEKQLQLKVAIKISTNFEISAFLAYSALDRIRLSRIFSNVLDNSIQAMRSGGKIEIAMRVALGSIMISISDSGTGIPVEILPRIFERKFTHGKLGGSGLGLSSAKEAIDGVGGSIAIQNRAGGGAVVQIELPVGNQPTRWMDKLKILDRSRIIIVDDQETSHDAWRMKLRGHKDARHLHSGQELKDLLSSSETDDDTLYLIDYDLGTGEMTGIALAQQLKLIRNTILVTGHYDDPLIQSECEGLSLRILPKPMIDSIAIV